MTSTLASLVRCMELLVSLVHCWAVSSLTKLHGDVSFNGSPISPDLQFTYCLFLGCFYINLPLGVITVGVILVYFQNPDRAAIADLGWNARIKEFDLEGTAAFIPAIVCLLLALQWGGTEYAWGSWRIIMLFVLFGLLISAFIGIQFWKQDSATIPPRIIKKRSVWSAAYYAFALGAFFLLLVFYLPIWFQAVKGASAVKSGIMNLPLSKFLNHSHVAGKS